MEVHGSLLLTPLVPGLNLQISKGLHICLNLSKYLSMLLHQDINLHFFYKVPQKFIWR